MKLFEFQTITHVSPSKVERSRVFHTTDASTIKYPLTGDFAAGANDARVERLEVDQEILITSQAVNEGASLCKFCRQGCERELRTAVRVRRIR